MSNITLNARHPFTGQPAREPSKNNREPSSLEERIQALTRIINAPISDMDTLSLDACKFHLNSIKEIKSSSNKYLSLGVNLHTVCEILLYVGLSAGITLVSCLILLFVIGLIAGVMLFSSSFVSFGIILLSIAISSPLMGLAASAVGGHFIIRSRMLDEFIKNASNHIPVLQKRVLPLEIDDATKKQFPPGVLELINGY